MYRPLCTKAYRGPYRRLFVTNPQPLPKKVTGVGEDFRPRWVYVYTRLISYGIIPGTLLSSYMMEPTRFKPYIPSDWNLLCLHLRLRRTRTYISTS